ncbi:Cytosolic beta-glucosidase [Fukomys damarensis]|uniref:Cytosolic beta-glucosidase n=1 Tax=Fukomys damarensis TaxID=885580 RepID=A0A091CTG0_FUKDA|nr:Cytosolic beta-glucosidase [Fukomys damarensis]
MGEKQGYPSSRLSEFTEEEKKMIKGTADFFAVQYMTRLIRPKENKEAELGIREDAEIETLLDPSWKGLGPAGRILTSRLATGFLFYPLVLKANLIFCQLVQEQEISDASLPKVLPRT